MQGTSPAARSPRYWENYVLDEKLFTVGEAKNTQNDRILATTSNAIPEHLKYIDRVQKPLSVMVWGGVTANSRTNLIFLPNGVKINSETYKTLILETEIKDAGSRIFKNQEWIFQQNSAQAHASNVTQSWFKGQNIKFLSKTEWPPSSPDLNLLDYSVWGNLERRACANLIKVGSRYSMHWTENGMICPKKNSEPRYCSLGHG